MRISVVIVTYNRNKDCKEAVNSILKRDPYEIIVVDDSSYPPFKFEACNVKVLRNENEYGLAASRNIGVKSSTGDVVAFLDDDAIASPDWIESIRREFTDAIDVIGGPCEPIYLATPPSWWDEELFGILVGINNKGVIGCNFAVRRDVFAKVGYFNEKLGRTQRKLISREETQFFERVMKQGGRIVFEENIKVFHKVYPNRMTMPYLMRRAWYEGVSEKLQYPHSIRKMLGCFRRIVIYSIKILFDRRKARYYLVKIVVQLGFIFPVH